MKIIQYKWIFIGIAITLVVASLISVAIFGLNLGIDFTGGALTSVTYTSARPAVADIEAQLNTLNIGTYSLRLSGDNGYILRTKNITDAERQSIVGALTEGGKDQLSDTQFTAIGPTIGSELRFKSFEAIAIVLLAIILFISFSFRKVSKPVSSWKYGVIAILALVHDIAIPTGVFAILGHFSGVEVDSLFVTALLVILGYSVNDTIVVFDRVRENLRYAHDHNTREEFGSIVGRSLDQTFGRSINTVLTVVIALLALYFLGGVTIHAFVLALLIGVVSGAYSSLFIASPLLVMWEGWQKKEN